MFPNSDADRSRQSESIIGSNVFSDSAVVGNSYVLNIADPARGERRHLPAPSRRTGDPGDEPVVFINYRTGDEEASATLIERELSNRFGCKKIFRAEKSILAGDDIETVIIRAVRRSSAVVAVIGQRWLGATDKLGRRALDDQSDWTRKELVEARDNAVRVIPVLIGETPCLDSADLPPALGWLAGCKYLRLNYRDVDGGLARLADQLAELVPGLDNSGTPDPPDSVDRTVAAPEGPHAPAPPGNTQGQSAVTQTFHGPVNAPYGLFGIANH